MPLAIFRRYLSFAAAVAVATLAGCGMTKPPISKKQFSQNVAALLAGKESAVVEAGKLADFAWSRLCFEREDSLLLTFDQGVETSVLPLPYEEFFVDEAHVANSLENSCITPADRILVKRKYPGDHGRIEFQKATQEG
ncbi:hypothetical protein [Xanthomonas euvesicatoria]|uniref:hypothetical protein n=1 Tax=Xanthomonas euvesicatoria TaxID=456327 RepID=UPI000F8DE774|nr:hypothetical protein [Xanthomonas euvesicatoria]